MSFLSTSFHFVFNAFSAAIFGIVLLLLFVLTAPMEHHAFLGLYRYDYLLFLSLLIQGILLYFKLETWEEAKVIALFHVLAMVMELVLTHPSIGSWHYPQPAVFKLWTVPLFTGFMYSAVGSFLARSLRLYQVSFVHLPSLLNMLALSILSYVNFMTKFFIWDIRYLLFIWSFVIFYRSKVRFSLQSYQIQLPMLLVLWILAGVIWIAENISTFYHIWLYPSQVEQWHMVGWGKLGSWYLLLLLSLVLVLSVSGHVNEQKKVK